MAAKQTEGVIYSWNNVESKAHPEANGALEANGNLVAHSDGITAQLTYAEYRKMSAKGTLGQWVTRVQATVSPEGDDEEVEEEEVEA